MMLGGVIGGYSATGRLTAATAPPRAMTIDSTAAKIGRSMKKCENNAPVLRARGLLPAADVRRRVGGQARGQQFHQRRLRQRRRRQRLHRDLRPRPHTLHAVDDDALAGAHALLVLLA